jgi:hypothetical protein
MSLKELYPPRCVLLLIPVRQIFFFFKCIVDQGPKKRKENEASPRQVSLTGRVQLRSKGKPSDGGPWQAAKVFQMTKCSVGKYLLQESMYAKQSPQVKTMLLR